MMAETLIETLIETYPWHEAHYRNASRYLAISDWAKARYTTRNPGTGETRLVISWAGGARPSRYSRIEDLAAARYLGLRQRHPGFALNQCPAW